MSDNKLTPIRLRVSAEVLSAAIELAILIQDVEQSLVATEDESEDWETFVQPNFRSARFRIADFILSHPVLGDPLVQISYRAIGHIDVDFSSPFKHIMDSIEVREEFHSE